jgi:hypothetical protein
LLAWARAQGGGGAVARHVRQAAASSLAALRTRYAQLAGPNPSVSVSSSSSAAAAAADEGAADAAQTAEGRSTSTTTTTTTRSSSVGDSSSSNGGSSGGLGRSNSAAWGLGLELGELRGARGLIGGSSDDEEDFGV